MYYATSQILLFSRFFFIHSPFFSQNLYGQNQTIGGNLTGEPLQEYLRENYTPNSTLGYNIARDRMYTTLDNEDGYVVGVYTYYEVPVDPNSSTPRADAYQNGQGMNAEHLWPQSKGADSGPPNSDLHHLYSTEIRVNADRGNLKFGTIPDEETDLWYNKEVEENTGNIYTSTSPPESERPFYSKRKNDDRFEVKLDRKGDVARAMFYFYTIYRDVADSEGPGFFDSMDTDLHEWHNLDEVDSYEVWRSESIEDWQGNVNPFVMDTTLVRRAYFTEDGGTDPDPDPEFEEIFTETFGTVSSSTDISAHQFDNAGFTFEGNGDIRESLPSEGYENASGNAQVFMNLGDRFVTISGIDSEGYEQLALQFGVYANSSTPFVIEYSTDLGENWQSLQNVPAQTANTWTQLRLEAPGLPSAEQLAIRFSKSGGQQYRLDDVRLEGVARETTANEQGSELADQVALNQNYPNPFNPATTIEFELPRQQDVKLAIYDMLGREVSLLADGIHSSGNHIYSWDASNFSSGIYIYTLETGSRRITRKMTLMK